LQDYYLKLITDHPLLCYLEDAFSEQDMEGFRTFKRALARKFPSVQMGVFYKSMEHMQSMTTWEGLDEEESQQWV
jgi:enolase